LDPPHFPSVTAAPSSHPDARGMTAQEAAYTVTMNTKDPADSERLPSLDESSARRIALGRLFALRERIARAWLGVFFGVRHQRWEKQNGRDQTVHLRQDSSGTSNLPRLLASIPD
jgi:hypothetical protein